MMRRGVGTSDEPGLPRVDGPSATSGLPATTSVDQRRPNPVFPDTSSKHPENNPVIPQTTWVYLGLRWVYSDVDRGVGLRPDYLSLHALDYTGSTGGRNAAVAMFEFEPAGRGTSNIRVQLLKLVELLAKLISFLASQRLTAFVLPTVTDTSSLTTYSSFIPV
ncbi:hypothetical protein DFH06DRAFT_1305234 [Mycena polygramma]|nr:hypothetical protein DFH06DRAFT_1305234 [Mycena polygramma]